MAVLNQACLAWANTLFQFHQAWFFALLQFTNERRCCVHAITSGFPVDCTYIIYIYISTLGILGCPFDAHWIPRWFPFGYTLGTLDFQLGPIAMPMGSPCHSHMGSHWSSIGSPWYSRRGHPFYAHEIPMGSPVGSPWIPMWSP